MKYFHPEADFLRKFQVSPPETTSHGTEADIKKMLKPAEISSWRLEGNRLIAETELGPVSNLIPTDMIMTGIGDDGLPILAKINQ